MNEPGKFGTVYIVTHVYIQRQDITWEIAYCELDFGSAESECVDIQG